VRRLQLLFFLLGGFLFYLLLKRFGLGALVRGLVGQGPRFLLILIPTAISYLLFCVAWWLVLESPDRRAVGFGRLFVVSMVGFSLNYMTPVLPFGGEPLKMLILSRRLGQLRAVSTVLAYNALHLLSHMVIFVAACLAGYWLMDLTPVHAGALGAATLLALALVYLILSAHEHGLVRGVFGFLSRRRLLARKRERLAATRDRFQRYEDSVTSFYHQRRRTFWIALAVDFLGRSIWAMEVLIMLRNIHVLIGPLRAFFIHSISSLLMVATFFVPYELGTREGAFFVTLSWVDLDPSFGLYLGVASRLREVVWIAVGLVIMAALGIRPSALANRRGIVRGEAE